MVMFHSYVSLPEGISCFYLVQYVISIRIFPVEKIGPSRWGQWIGNIWSETMGFLQIYLVFSQQKFIIFPGDFPRKKQQKFHVSQVPSMDWIKGKILTGLSPMIFMGKSMVSG